MRIPTWTLGIGLLALACQKSEPANEHHWKPQVAASAAATGIEIDSAKLGLYAPLPDVIASPANPSSEDKVSLGRMLYYDARFSKNQDLSCNTCHDLAKSGVDGKDFSSGPRGKKVTRNTPSTIDAAAQFAEFWDGRAETIEDAVKAHVLDPAILGMSNADRILATAKSMPEYVSAFKKAFPDDADPTTVENFAKAIGSFTRKLTTPSKWDRLLKGEGAALSDDEKKGFLKFVEVGCPTCHVGALVGATMFQKLGKEKPWPNQSDKGRSAVTHSASDDMMFKVASLRNIERTAPFFHDASAKTLEVAVKTMASVQLAKDLSDDDVKSIVTWLDTLTGTVSADYVKKPDLPASTPKTPKPDPK